MIYQADISSIENKMSIVLSKNFYSIKKYIIYQIFVSHIKNSVYLKTTIILLSYLNDLIPEIVEIVLNYTLIQLKEAYKRHDCFILKITLRFIVYLVNSTILDVIFLCQLVFLVINQKTYFALYTYLLLKAEIDFIDNKITEKLLSIEKNNKIFSKSKALSYIVKENFKYFSSNKINKKSHLFKIETRKLKKFKFGFLDVLYTFKIDSINDLKIKKKLLIEQYNFFVVLYLKNFMKFNINKKFPIMSKIKSYQNRYLRGIQEQKIISLSLKRRIYLILMSSLNPKEAVLKLFKLNILNNNLNYIVSILTECCIQEDKYLKYYSQVAELLCKSSVFFKKFIEIAFLETSKTIFRYKINKIKISGNFFGYLFSTGSLSWKFLFNMVISIMVTTIYLKHSNSSMRIFLKYILTSVALILGKSFLKSILKNIISKYSTLNIHRGEKIISEIYKGVFKDYETQLDKDTTSNSLIVS